MKLPPIVGLHNLLCIETVYTCCLRRGVVALFNVVLAR